MYCAWGKDGLASCSSSIASQMDIGIAGQTRGKDGRNSMYYPSVCMCMHSTRYSPIICTGKILRPNFAILSYASSI